MNYRSISTILLSLCLMLSFSVSAQLDSRNRTPETIISDGLTQLPTNNQAKYNEVIGEMAATGAKGIEMLADMLKPAQTNQNATFEYAIDAIVSYATREDNAAKRQGIHDGLVAAVKKCTDKPNKAFLITQLNKLAQPADIDLYLNLLSDSYLRHYAVNGLSHMPGADTAISNVIAQSKPDADLAYLAYFRKLKSAEPTLIKWAQSNDTKVLTAVYNALAACGSDASLETLYNAAKAHNFGDDPTGATDAYLRLIGNLESNKATIAAAKELTKCNTVAARCAGLGLLLGKDSQNTTKNILDALKDKDIQYRNTALLLAPSVCGEDIYTTVAGKLKSYSPAAQADIIAWLGNNHVASQIDCIIKSMGSKSPEVAANATAAASKIGGEKALEALIKRLSAKGESADAAQTALLSFNGKINPGVITALDSKDANVVTKAIQLASTRHIYDAYPKTKALLNSKDAAISAAALEGLKGVVRPENFNDICTLLDAATDAETIAKLQAAACNSIASLDNDSQYKLINGRLANTPANIAGRYYTMLAQAATPAAIEHLLSEYKGANKAAAFDALLQVKSPAMIDVLYDLAADNTDSRDTILRRYVQLVKGAGLSGIENYRLYSRALDLNPADDVKVSIIKSLSSSRTLPALMLSAGYIDYAPTAMAAATTAKYIIAKEDGLRKGATVKNILEKAHKIFVDRKVNDADAGYAADETAGLINGLDVNGGYNIVEGLTAGDDVENFDIYFDWNNSEPTVVTLRSLPLLILEPGTVQFGDKKVEPAKGWNNIHVRLINDRAFVDVNGNPLIVNQAITNGINTPVSGKVMLDGGKVRNFYFNHLPDTPIYTLSDEEKELGFEVLFDGRSLDKWHGNTSAYVPVDGNIYVTAQYGGSGNLYTKKNFSDFVYRFEFWFDVPAVNNGIGIRTGKDVTGVDAAFHGMEIQVLDHDDPIYQGHPFGYTGLKPYQNHGSVYGVIPSKHVDFGPIKQWHTEEIRAIGDRITVIVDGEVILDGNIREACQGHAVGDEGEKGNHYMIDHRNHPGLFNKEGYISFCGHGAGVKFRNVRVLDLSDKATAKKYQKKLKQEAKKNKKSK